MNYYDVLEISQKASKEVIRQAYRTLVKKHQPDTQPEALKKQAEEHTVLLNKAYEVLSDDDKRRIYDQTLFSEFKKENETPVSVPSSMPKRFFIGFRNWVFVVFVCSVGIIGLFIGHLWVGSPSNSNGNYMTFSSPNISNLKPSITPDFISPPVKTEVKSVISEPIISSKVDLPPTVKTEIKPKATTVLKPENYFSLGSTKEEVKSIMGTPSGINDYSSFIVWNYGFSSVKFNSSGKVIGWSGSDLKMTMGVIKFKIQNLLLWVLLYLKSSLL